MEKNANTEAVVDVVIPAQNCASLLGPLIASLPTRFFRSVIVVAYGSRDSTAQVGRDAGAVVLRQSRGGYGAACKRALAHLEALPTPPSAVVFLPPDQTVDVQDLSRLISPIVDDNAELVLGAREKGAPERGYVRLSRRAISLVYRHRLDDIGPFRAIRFPALVALSLGEDGEAWNVEMIVKALAFGLHVVEVPVSGWPALRLRKRALRESLRTTGRAFYQILRYSTTR